jgi:hypothetical protein
MTVSANYLALLYLLLDLFPTGISVSQYSYPSKLHPSNMIEFQHNRVRFWAILTAFPLQVGVHLSKKVSTTFDVVGVVTRLIFLVVVNTSPNCTRLTPHLSSTLSFIPPVELS